MAADITPEEIKEFLNYMEKIKTFEDRYKLQIHAVERIIWGFLLIIAGILDFIFSGYVFDYGPSFIPWILIIPVGLLMTNFLTQRTTIIEKKKEKIPFYKQPITIAFALTIIVIAAFSNRTLYFLIMPCVAVIMGTVVLIDKLFTRKISLPVKQEIIEYLTPILTIATAVVNLLGFFFITNINVNFLNIVNSDFSIFSGLIFGGVFGVMEIIEAYLTKNMLSNLNK